MIRLVTNEAENCTAFATRCMENGVCNAEPRRNILHKILTFPVPHLPAGRQAGSVLSHPSFITTLNSIQHQVVNFYRFLGGDVGHVLTAGGGVENEGGQSAAFLPVALQVVDVLEFVEF